MACVHLLLSKKPMSRHAAVAISRSRYSWCMVSDPYLGGSLFIGVGVIPTKAFFIGVRIIGTK